MHHHPFRARGTTFATQLLCASLATFAALPHNASAQPAATAAVRSYAIPAGPLGPALNQWGRESGTLITFAPELVAGERTRGASGSLSTRQALDALLMGTGLSASAGPQGAYVLRRIPQTPPPEAGPHVQLAEVRVVAQAEATTEGSGSYVPAGPSSTATGLRLALRETPQSVTTVTRQQMDDQALHSVQEVLEQTVGVHMDQSDSERAYPTIRGFSVPSLQLDGAPLPTGDNLFGYAYLLQDSAAYDRVEVVRGAAGLLNGVGTPAGAINLVRKKPTRTFQAAVEANLGSWNRYRTLLDISSPLNAEGSLRGRLVTAYQDRQSFMEHYRQKRTDVYAVLEADLAPATLLTVGAEQVTSNADAPSWGPLPLFLRDGTPYDAPRTRNPGVKWGRFDTTTRSLFAEVEHHFGNAWVGKFSAHRLENHREQDLVSGAYDWPALDGSGVRANVSQGPDTNKTTVLNASASGGFTLWGRQHQAHFGAHYSDIDGHSDVYYSATRPGRALYLDIPDFFTWDNDFAHPTLAHWGYWYRKTRQVAAHGALQLRITDALAVIPGARLTSYKDSSHRYLVDGAYAWGSAKEEKRVLTPFLGMVYDVSPGLSLYASYAEIFTPQTFTDVNGDRLDPIVGRNVEIGAKGALPGNALQGSVAFFSTEERNNAESDGDRTTPSGDYAYRNGKGMLSRGVEVELSGKLAPHWNIYGGYTLKRTRREAELGLFDSALPPNHLLKLSTDYRLPGAWSRLRIGGALSWQSRMETTKTFGGVTATRVQGAYALLNLSAHYDLTRQTRLSLHIDNVLDKHYYAGFGGYGGGYWGAPRNFLMTLRHQF